MKTVIVIISVVMIILVLLQSSKASDASQIITGGNAMLMAKSKERGAEKFITNLTYTLGFLFILLSFILSL